MTTTYSQDSCQGPPSGPPVAYPGNAQCQIPTPIITLNGFAIGGYIYDTCYTPPANPSNLQAPSCFAGSESILLANGSTFSIADVDIGQSVLAFDSITNTFVYAEVIAKPHSRNSIVATFQHITLESGLDIKLTPAHLLPKITSKSQSSQLTQAVDIQIGDYLLTTSGVSRVLSNKVVVSREGIYTIVTDRADFLVINGVVASPFAVNHAVAHWMYRNVYRVCYHWKLLPPSMMTAVLSTLASYFA